MSNSIHVQRVRGALAAVLVAGALPLAAGRVGHAQPPAASPTSPPAAMRPIAVRHRDAAGMAEQVRRMLGADRAAGVFVSPASNEILVRGSRADQALVAQIIEKLDQPVAQRPAAPPRLEAYRVPDARREAAQRWAGAFRGGDGERAAWDERTGQLIVFGAPAVHQQAQQILQDGAASELNLAGVKPGTSTVRLQTLSPDELHGRLERLVSRPLPATSDAAKQSLNFPVQLGDAPGVTLRIDGPSRTVHIEGDPQPVAAWTQVIAAMDNARNAGAEQATRVVTATESRRPAIRRALSALGGQNAQQQGPGRLVTMLLQPQPAGDSDPARGDQAPLVGQQPPADQAGDTSLLGPVQVEFVEGLDIIVLRGNDRDVARVMEIINQIEQLSAVTVPEIEVYPLKHVASVPMARLLSRVYERVLGPRTGSVSITPLGKPNALLLIGREENVKRAIDLTSQLDKPVEPSARFEVFPLRHAAAGDAKELIDEYLEEPDGDEDETGAALPATARVVADFRSNSLIVSASTRGLDEIRAIVARIDVAQGAAVDEVRIFPLRNALASDLADVLRTAISQTGEEAAGEGETAPRSASLRFVTIDRESRERLESGIVTSVRIAPDARANSLVVTAPADSMQLIAALIEQLDRSPDAEAELKVFTIANGDATALVEMLESLFNTEEDDPAAGGLGGATNSLVRLQLSVDERTNSIIAAGTQEDLDVVYAILTRLDGADTRQRVNRVFRLNNASAENVAETLTQWLDSRAEAEENAELAISPFEQIDREVILSADGGSNSLIISATPELYEEIEALIRELDEQPPMVVVQVLIAEVRLNDTDEFGIELGLQDSLLFDRSAVGTLETITTTTQDQSPGGAILTTTEQTIVNAPLTPGFNFNNPDVPLGNNGSTSALLNAGAVAAQGLVNFGVGRVSQAAGFGGFVLSASSNSIDTLLRALQENRRLEVLSRPQIAMLDGQQGRVSVGQSVARIQGVSIDQFGRQSNQLDDVDVGIILDVTPLISPEGQVVMRVSATRSEVGPELEGTPVFIGEGGAIIRSPAINQTVAETTVMAATGQTVILGGLLTKSTFDIHRRVPLLADIPLLGDLFRFDSVSEERTELLIILTPRVIRSGQDADMIKQVESSRMSWVLGDVVAMHGPSGLRGRGDEWNDCEAVYPTGVPTSDVLPPAPGVGPQLIEPDVLPSPPISAGAADEGVETASYQQPAAPRAAIQRLPPVTR